MGAFFIIISYIFLKNSKYGLFFFKYMLQETGDIVK